MRTVTFCLSGADLSCELLIANGGEPKRLLLRTDHCDYTELSVELSESEGVEITVTPTAHPGESDPLAPTSRGFDRFLRETLRHAAAITRNRLLLRVGREYLLTNLQDGERLSLTHHTFVSEPIHLLRLMESAPVIYSFFELKRENGTAKTVRAMPANREDLFLVERATMLRGIGLKTILSYPFRMGRIKRLTRERRLRRALKKYSLMSDEEREKHLQSSLHLL
ncbi:MAG: hypothetical protein E7620_05455 [Ruminococcaceae bacterium]|nr:hypothetical protein [Oscillospiraceae bacterium]